jgi:hypothetical protein
MQIDARDLEVQDLLTRLKDILSAKRGSDVNIEILSSSRDDTIKTKSFVDFSGCQTKIEKKEGYYIIRITGSPCCV